MRRTILAVTGVALLAMAGAAVASDTNTLTVSATVTGTCKFSSPTSSLNFGTLDPAVGSDKNVTNTTQFWCTKGVLQTIAANGGLNFDAGSGKRAVKESVSGDIIPYTLSLTLDANPNAGPSSPRTLTLGGGVLGTDYVGKSAGSYSDTVTLSINP